MLSQEVNEQAEVTIRHADLMEVFLYSLRQHESKVRGNTWRKLKTRICL